MCYFRGSHSCLLVFTQVTTFGFFSEEHASDVKFFAENSWTKADRVIKQNCEVMPSGWRRIRRQ